MATKELIKRINKLPPKAQREAEDFVEFLSKKYLLKDRTSSKNSLLDSQFRGMWKDREDMKDSTQWVRNIRKSRFSD